jgi:hypothetical protein
MESKKISNKRPPPNRMPNKLKYYCDLYLYRIALQLLKNGKTTKISE